MIAGDTKSRSFALKQMKKSQIVETRQQQHIMSGMLAIETQTLACSAEMDQDSHASAAQHNLPLSDNIDKQALGKDHKLD